MHECPCCNGPGAYLGCLGRDYYRCVACGYQWSEVHELSEDELDMMEAA